MTDSPLGRPPRPAAILLNAAAGSAGTLRTRRTIDLVQRGLEADLLRVSTRDAEELAAWLRAHATDYRTLVVAGGDGTLGVAYNVMAGRDTLLGYLPAGFGNATAHLLNLPRDPDRLAATILAAEARRLDLVRVDGRLALFAGAGWDALVAGRYADAGARGTVGWGSAVLRSLPALFRRPTVRLRIDGEPAYDGPMELLVAGTTPYFGRGLLVNPGARPDAGRLRLRLYPGPAPRLAVEALRWVANRTPDAPHWDAAGAELKVVDGSVPLQADGDRIGESDLWSFALAPAAVRIIGHWRRPTAG